MRADIYNGVVITSIHSFVSSMNGKVVSIMRRVPKSLECMPIGHQAWGVELAIFGQHFAYLGK
jgi:hypothetical protein